MELFGARSEIRDPGPDFAPSSLASSSSAPIGDPVALDPIYYRFLEPNPCPKTRTFIHRQEHGLIKL